MGVNSPRGESILRLRNHSPDKPENIIHVIPGAINPHQRTHIIIETHDTVPGIIKISSHTTPRRMVSLIHQRMDSASGKRVPLNKTGYHPSSMVNPALKLTDMYLNTLIVHMVD